MADNTVVTAAEGGRIVPAARADAAAFRVREGEDPWTDAELDAVQAQLVSEAEGLRQEIVAVDADLTSLLLEANEGAGEDQADAGSKTFEREHEMSIARNSRDLLAQVERALDRMVDGSYGSCESCGQPISKGRLQAFPRAVLCMTCKQREERR